jgi:hypothetical protein
MTSEIELSRAELVRRRRRQQTQKRVAESSALATRPLAPITSRKARFQPTPKRAPAARNPRRYQAALSMPGIEVQMPSISFTGPAVKWRLFSFSLAVVLSAAIYLAWTRPEFLVSKPQVSGNQRIQADEIRAALGIGGQPIFSLISHDLENRLRLNYPELLSAHIAVNLPDQVFVTVTERKPSILWQQDGGYTWIDDNGVAFRPRGTADGLITVQALAAPPAGVAAANDPLSPLPYLSAEMVAAIKTLAPSAPAGTPMIYDPRYGLGWADGRGWQAYFGSTTGDMSLRLRVYQSLVTMLAGKAITPVLINVQYPNAPYYRMN